MSILYLCYDCGNKLKLHGIEAINDVGRKHCEGCGDNTCYLEVIKTEKVNKAIKKWNKKHQMR